MTLRYAVDTKLIQLDKGAQPQKGTPIIEVFTEAEFKDFDDVSASTKHDIATLLLTESCCIEITSHELIGSMAVPNKKALMGDRDLFSFYCTPELLVFIDEGTIAEETIKAVVSSDLSQDATTFGYLYAFLRELVIDDATWLGMLEDNIEDAEEAMLGTNVDISTESITAYRRASIRMTTYYQQLASMTLAIASNENGLLNEREIADFKRLVSQVDRLADRAETIREYSLQLRELHQTKLDIKQNNVMQILTIVTVLFAPLTLLAGWFGMNFANMPGISEPWGFPLICIIGLIVTIALLLWFRRKRWL